MSKYNAIRTNGYASKKEAARAQQLKLMQQAGLITDLREQVAFVIAPPVVVAGRKRPAMKYIADFVYIEDGKLVVNDAKGVLTAVYKIKRHLMKVVNQIDILET